MTGEAFQHEVPITFGDCDPAGIVFYPRFFAWMDAGFHAFLRARGTSHAALCAQFGACGIGLITAQSRFLSPARDGDLMRLELRVAGWSARSLRLAHSGWIGPRQVFAAEETRGIFIPAADGKLTAGPTAPLRAILEADSGRAEVTPPPGT